MSEQGVVKKFYCSDLHFFHKNICRFTNRQLFTNPEEHTEWLIQIWNSQVRPGDLVYHLGDFFFTTDYEKIRGVMERLNGQKICLKGNHCNRQILNRLKIDGLIEWWGDYREEKIGKTSLVMFHFPVACWHRQHYGAWHIHGHSHGNYHGKGKVLDVGLDSAYNVLGEHRFFTEEDIKNFMDTREVVVYDHHEYREGEL